MRLLKVFIIVFVLAAGAVIFRSYIPLSNYLSPITPGVKEEATRKILPRKSATTVPKVQETNTSTKDSAIAKSVPVSEAPPLEKKKDIEKIAPIKPLRTSQEEQSSALTNSGVIFNTNLQRALNILPPLKENVVLDKIAEARMKDMFEKQYFEHTSPAGESASSIAKNLGYEYISIGENLALGNFKNDEKLVDAWMNSPGHRANILNKRFQQIGAAVGEGVFDGRKTWIAVQIFGFPLSACPKIDVSLKDEIETRTSELKVMETTLYTMKTDIESTYPKYGSSYNQKVESYNLLVSKYNTRLSELKSLISVYNSEVRAFNTCLSGA